VAGLQDAATVAAQQAKTLNVEGFIVGLKVARAMP
jgi:hypothetical protein